MPALALPCARWIASLAGMQSGGIRYEFSVCVTNNGKTPGQGCIGVQMGERPGKIVQPGLALAVLFADCVSELLRQQFDASPTLFGPRHAPPEAKGRAIHPFPMLAQVAGRGGIKLRSKQGQPIPCLAQSCRRMDQAQGEMIQPLLVAGDAISGGPAQRRSKIGNFGGGFVPSLSGKFGGGSRRSRTQVGDQVDDGGIGLVSDAADDGEAAGGNSPCDDFLVESPQVFDAAPTAYHKQQLAFIASTCGGDCRGNFAAAASPCTSAG